jgi:hypothetical protein
MATLTNHNKLKLALLFTLVALLAASSPYSTSFPATENPIVETGLVVNRLVVIFGAISR